MSVTYNVTGCKRETKISLQLAFDLMKVPSLTAP
jgi:hypothetical protein